MKTTAPKRTPSANLLFDLTEAGTAYRNHWRLLAAFLVWVILSGFTILLNVFVAEGQIHRVIVIGMSLLKYVPMLMAAGSLARQKAAKYLADVYELENEEMANNFLEEVAFGGIHNSPLLVIEEGGITEEDERSQLILIGGPGRIQVNLDSAALLEKVDGTPEVIYPRKDAWELGSFERIREIGESDILGDREYAIINLREQRIKNIRVMARTKDGVPVEARDVKIKFSVLKDDRADFLCEEKAICALVYQQTTITPETKIEGVAGFPWDTTVIPLVVSEIEKVISSHTADEIAVGIGQKEMELNADIEKTAEQARQDATGKHAMPAAARNAAAVALASREKINNQFYEEPFKSKAADMGVRITWIDIGTWQPVGSIREKIRDTWNKARENLKKHNAVKATRKKYETVETLSLMDIIINPMHERVSARATSKDRDRVKELEEFAEKNPNVSVNTPKLESYKSAAKEPPAATAREMLKAFRKELLAGRAILAERDTTLTEEEKRAEIARIESVIQHINQYFPVTHTNP